MSTDFMIVVAMVLSCPLGTLPAAGHAFDLGPSVVATPVQGPAQLEALLARYDALSDGPEKDELERRIDALAGQRYATVSRLYWHQDLARAKDAARASGRPILSLRMLGRLDEDLSCANSRLFRVVLYANEELSNYLRENFVLHWSSERPVPKVTFDFGDGRVLRTTLAGNSAHYVLDAEGHPLDVLPGLYDPVAFRRELEAILPLARESASLSSEQRVHALTDFHAQRGREAALARLAPEIELLPVAGPAPAGIVAAELMSVSKGVMELPGVDRLGLGARSRRTMMISARGLADARLDERSRKLVRRLAPTDWSAAPRALDGAELEALIGGLEESVAQDTELNERQLHARIRGWFQTRKPIAFDALNERLYREIFLTPARDPWLGIDTPGAFNGLPRDGIGAGSSSIPAATGRRDDERQH